jgi:hypothetical protein
MAETNLTCTNADNRVSWNPGFWVAASPGLEGRRAPRADQDARRAERVHIIAAADPDGRRSVGLRSDAENYPYHF